MQDNIDKISQFNNIVGELFKEIREENTSDSMSKFAREYDFDRVNLIKTERGIYSIQLITAWKLSEALGIKFSDIAKRLEDKLGEKFKLIEE